MSSYGPRQALILAAVLLSVGVAAPAGRAAPGPDRSGVDRAVAPGDDFFAYANGGWLRTAVIPQDRASTGVDDMLIELTQKRTAAMIEDIARNPAGPDQRKIADYYAAFMDEAAIEKAGLAPLKEELAGIAAIRSRADLARALGATVRADVDLLNETRVHTDRPLGLWVAQDLDNPQAYSPFLVQGGLGMPDRDYYLDPSPRMQAIREAYRSHIAKVLDLAGIENGAAKAATILDLERRIAQSHVSRADTSNVVKGDNHWTQVDFETRAPGLEWSAFFDAARLAGQSRFVVWQPSAVKGLSALAASESLDTWRAYLAFHALDRASPFLPKAFVDERFDFYGRALSGTPLLSERWKRGVDATNDALGEAVGRYYVDRYFPPAAKAQVEAMVAHLVAAYARRIDSLDWMAPTTKVQAKAKLAALKIGVGYPDHWRNYDALSVTPGDALGNARRAALFEYARDLAKLGKPVDRGEWVMTPQTVNAVNLPAMNALNFPAAYLQPPTFDPAASAAANYGAIGATIGHEISHSFDDTGALFDATGRLANWWTPADLKHFKASGAALVRQFDGYRPFPDLAVNGEQTLSENIADLAGLTAAHEAYRMSLGGKPAPVIDGLTGDQQFFLAYGQSWREKTREAALREQIITDGHAPSEYRADTVRNLDAWYQAYDVKPGQKLYLDPADRVRMW